MKLVRTPPFRAAGRPVASIAGCLEGFTFTANRQMVWFLVGILFGVGLLGNQKEPLVLKVSINAHGQTFGGRIRHHST